MYISTQSVYGVVAVLVCVLQHRASSEVLETILSLTSGTPIRECTCTIDTQDIASTSFIGK
jgi:hypothetical protein